jgi:hypothetical protein
MHESDVVVDATMLTAVVIVAVVVIVVAVGVVVGEAAEGLGAS